MTDENRDDGMRVEVANGEQTFELSFADKCLLISADTRHSASLDVETTLHFLTSGKGTERRSTN